MAVPVVARMVVAADKRLHVKGLANLARTHDVAEGEAVGIPAAALEDGQDSIARDGRIDHAVYLFDSQSERLLAHDVLSSAQRGNHGIGMDARWSPDHDQLDIGIGEHLLRPRMGPYRPRA